MQDQRSAIERWLQQADEELLYTPDGASPECADVLRQSTDDAARAMAARIDAEALELYRRASVWLEQYNGWSADPAQVREQ